MLCNLVDHISEDLHLPPKDPQISCKRSKKKGEILLMICHEGTERE
jgi:hypothetical protein